MIPVWVRRRSAIWLATATGPDPRAPAGAYVLPLPEAHRLIGGAPLPAELAEAWVLGAAVEYNPDASPELASVADRLRSLLPERAREQIPAVAQRFGLPRTGLAMAAADEPQRADQLADAVMDTHPDGVPRLSAEARILRALTGL